MSRTGNYKQKKDKATHTKQFKKEQRKLRSERRRVVINWLWNDFERWVCYRRAKRIMVKDQAFLMIQESTNDDIKIMYKKR